MLVKFFQTSFQETFDRHCNSIEYLLTLFRTIESIIAGIIKWTNDCEHGSDDNQKVWQKHFLNS